MKTFLLALLLILAVQAHAQQNEKAALDSAGKSAVKPASPMKMYVLVLLTTGNTDIKDKAARDSVFAGHMKNIKRLAADGKLAVAGPFEKNTLNYRGLYVFNTASVEDAKVMVASDPAVQAGIFNAIYLPWYGSAALMEVNKIHEKLERDAN